jgi:hypothetical protein
VVRGRRLVQKIRGAKISELSCAFRVELFEFAQDCCSSLRPPGRYVERHRVLPIPSRFVEFGQLVAKLEDANAA